MIKYLLAALFISGSAMAQGFFWLEKPTFCAESNTMLQWLKATDYNPIGRSWVTSEDGQIVGVVWLAVNSNKELMIVEQFDTFTCVVSISKGLELIKKPTI